MNNAPLALITGAAKRNGHHLALSLAQNGWDIAGHYNQSALEIKALQQQVQAQGQQFIPLQADLKDEASVTNLIPECVQELGPPSLLINNASLFEKDELGSIEGVQFDNHISINLKAPILLAQSFAKSQTKDSQDGKANIINITDQRAFKPNPSFYSYTVSKVGLAAATQTMAQSLAPTIRVNAIAPGPVLQSIHQTKVEFETECKTTLLGYGTSLDDIAKAVEFILATPCMTGETIHLDGGQRLA